MKTLTSDVSASLFYRVRLSCVMLALISSIIASIQLNHAIIDIQENYKRRRLNLSRLLSTTTSTFTRVKRLRCRRESKERRFWTRPGRTSAWWNNFADQVVIPEEWKENFRMSRDSLYNLAEELRPCAFGVWHRFMRLRAFSCGRRYKNMRLLAAVCVYNHLRVDRASIFLNPDYVAAPSLRSLRSN